MADDLASYVRGGRTPRLMDITIGEAIGDAARAWPDGTALISPEQDISWTWAQLAAEVQQVAKGLMSLGLQPGDRVAIWASNCAEWAVTQFATAAIGAILVNINPGYRTAEALFTLRKTGARLLIVTPRVKTSDYIAMTQAMAPGLFSPVPAPSPDLPMLERVVQIGGAARYGCLRFADLAGIGKDVSDESLREIEAAVDPRSAVNIQFTSGTTGTPKGATLSHRNILNNGYFVGMAIGLRPGDKVCINVPLYHCFGMVMGNLACVTNGAAMVYPSATFDPAASLRTIEKEGCTAFYGVPTMYIAALQQPDFGNFDLTSLRTGIMAGSPCPIEVMRQVVERMHMRDITISYGMTETSPVSFQSAPGDPLDKRVETVGRILPHLESKIVGPDKTILPRGEVGELCTRGYSVMLGYWDEPDVTATVLDADGWMHSGDLATIDAEGYCRIVGRIKDMIIRGGENIYPREIEEFLYSHGDIEDVSIVGIADPVYGEEVCAWIRVRQGAMLTTEDVAAFCDGRIAHYKIPRHIRFVSELPLTATGKVQKFEIRKRMEEELAAEKVGF